MSRPARKRGYPRHPRRVPELPPGVRYPGDGHIMAAKYWPIMQDHRGRHRAAQDAALAAAEAAYAAGDPAAGEHYAATIRRIVQCGYAEARVRGEPAAAPPRGLTTARERRRFGRQMERAEAAAAAAAASARTVEQ